MIWRKVYTISYISLDVEKPSHIKEFPTFFIRGPKGDFETIILKKLESI
jgi:hypothetical protein